MATANAEELMRPLVTPARSRLAVLPWLLPILPHVLKRAPSPDLPRWLLGEPGALWRLAGRELWLAIVLELEGAMGRPRDAHALAIAIGAARDWLDALSPSDRATVEEVLEVLDRHGWAAPALVDCDRWECFLTLLDALADPYR